MDCIVHGITKSWTQLSDFHFTSLPAILIKRKVTAISDFWPPSVNESSQNCNPMDAATPMVIAEELGKCKKQGEQGNRLSPDSWGAYARNGLSEPQGLHLPTHRMLSSLNWYLIFDVQTACFFCCKLAYSLTSPPGSLSSFLRATGMLPPGLRVLNIPSKWNSSLLAGCDYVF